MVDDDDESDKNTLSDSAVGLGGISKLALKVPALGGGRFKSGKGDGKGGLPSLVVVGKLI